MDVNICNSRENKPVMEAVYCVSIQSALAKMVRVKLGLFVSCVALVATCIIAQVIEGVK